MKTFLQVMILMMVSGFAVAQQNAPGSKFPVNAPKSPINVIPVSKVSPLKEYQALQTNRRSDARWMNFAIDYAQLTQTDPTYSLCPLFPDTNIIAGISGGKKFTPLYHAAAVILDPSNFLYDPYSGGTYFMDSLWIKYAYVRTTPDDIVDTLVFSVFEPNYNFWGILKGGVKLWWKVVGYDYTTNAIDPLLNDSAFSVHKYTYLLKPADAGPLNPDRTTEIKDRMIATPGLANIDLHNQLGVSVQFIPGYTYSYADEDSVFGKNIFFLYSSEALGKETDPIYSDSGNYNFSYVLTTEVRYGDTSSSFYRQFFPTQGYEDKFLFDSHLIYFHVREFPVGTNDLTLKENVNFYPNPVNENANLAYSLKSNAKKVSVCLYDLAGKELIRIDEGAKPAGDHHIIINTGSLPKGMYLYSFSVDGETRNGKIVVD